VVFVGNMKTPTRRSYFRS